MEALLAILPIPNVDRVLHVDALELVLGIDNIIFISILVDKLPPAEREKARRIGLFLRCSCASDCCSTLSWIVA
jgi:predicted tellurium resistance membrane protein TerC